MASKFGLIGDTANLLTAVRDQIRAATAAVNHARTATEAGSMQPHQIAALLLQVEDVLKDLVGD
jgi:hypothetical protein